MNRMFKCKQIAAIALTSLVTFFSISLPNPVVAEGRNQKNNDVPIRRIGGASRGCSAENSGKLMALVPEKNLTLTKSGHPNFWFYLSQNSTNKKLQSTSVEFVLLDDQNNVVYEKTWKTNVSKGIMNVKLPESNFLQPLAAGKKYQWFISLICNPKNRAYDIVVDGWIKRVEINSALAQKLELASPFQSVSIYTQAGLWQDAITALAQIRYAQPNNSNVADSWTKLLQSEKLGAIAKEPIVKHSEAKVVQQVSSR
ncbi:MAG: DUF928 domain-containing protein [Richelia sp.]|nr:DUF928 domain-containing protein [Richelia sp.]